MTMPDNEPQPGQAPMLEESPVAPGADVEIPEWLKSLQPEDIGLAPVAPNVVPAAAKAETVAVKEDELPDWLRPAVTPVPPASEQVIEGTVVAAPVVLNVELPAAPVAPGGDGGKPPEAPKPPETPEEAYARVGRPMAEARERRRAEREELPDSEKRFLAELPRVKTEVEQVTKDAENGRISDAAASNATEHSARLKAYLAATEDVSQIAEMRAGKRGAMGPEDQARKGDEIAKLQADIVCREGMLRELDLEGKKSTYETRVQDGMRLTDFYDEISKRRTDADVNVAKLEADFQGAEKRLRKQVGNGNLTEKDLFDILDCKAKEVTAAKEAAAKLAKEQEEAEGPKEGAQKLAIEAAKDARDAEAQADFIKKAITERDAAIAQATTEIAQSDQIRAETRARLDATRAKFDGLAGEYDRQLGLNMVARNIGELSTFVDRLAKVRIEPGGLTRQLAFLDQRIDYLQQPGTVEQLDPALESAVGSAVSIYEDMGMSPDKAGEAYLAKLLKDRTNLQLLRDISQDPYSLIETEGVPQILRQALEETRTEEGHRARGEAEGVGFLRSETNDKAVQAAQDVQRAAMAGVLEGFGLTLPATEAAREHWQTVGAELRAMYESGEVTADWARIIDKLEAVRKVRAEGAAAAAEAATKQTELEGQVATETNRATLAEAETASRENALRQTQQQVEDLTPLAGEVNRQIESAINSVDDRIWGLVPEDQKRELTTMELHLGETVGQRKEKIIRAAQAAWEAKLNTGSREADKAHQKEVAEDQRLMTEYHNGKLTLEQLVQRLRKTGGVAGVGARDKKPEELAATGLAVVDAEAQQVRRMGNVNPADARRMADKTSVMNTALEGAGILSSGMGGILDGGFKLAIESMFSAGR